MDPTHTGRSPKGKRIHLCNSRGWASCSRTFKDISPIVEQDFDVEAPWCQSCLGGMADEAASWITVFGVEGSMREERGFARLWDARAAIALGELINEYLADNPPPRASELAGDFAGWSAKLECIGKQLLKASGGV